MLDVQDKTTGLSPQGGAAMALSGVRPGRTARPNLGFAYLMIGIALGSIFVSGVLGSMFCPDMVTGALHEHFAIGAATGWVWGAIAIAMFVPAAMQGIRAGVADRAPWTMLGLGLSAIWFASMFVTIFAPVWVFGTDPDEFPFTAGIGAIAGLILTAILCNVVKTGSFQPAESTARFATTTPIVGTASAPDDATVKLRGLAQLRDSEAITEAEFEAKKKELLSRV
jgi:hypothetical protein